MKKIAKIVGCVAVLALCMSFDAPTSSDGQESYVYICTGSSSKRYHAISSCRGLGNCQESIIKINLSSATEKGRTPCKICYRTEKK